MSKLSQDHAEKAYGDTIGALNAAWAAGKLAGCAAPTVLSLPNGNVGFVIPNGMDLREVTPTNAQEPNLPRVRQRVTLHDAASFITYVKQFKTPNTRIFAAPGFLRSSRTAQIMAVFDYHESPGLPKRFEHFAIYEPRYSTQWGIWNRLVSGALKQTEFAEAIEENRSDIVEPSAAQLLDLVRTFKASRKVSYNSVVHQRDGTVVLGYQDVAEQGEQSTPLPEQLKIGIPVYFRDERFKIDLWVRYRVANGGVTFNLAIDRADVIEDEAFNQLLIRIGEAVSIAPLMGGLS